MIKKIKFASIPVADQGRALAFYTEKLGFEVARDTPFGDGLRWIELRIPGAETGIVLFTPQGQEHLIGTFSNVVYTSDDVQATYEELRARGVEFVQPPKEEPWGISSLFKDSEGNTILVGSSPD